ncbi:MAG: alpha/beta fold hydrolase [Emcibacter sp.]|nr:alpha/beta fold hydrolase [Emcibacter sp.]
MTDDDIRTSIRMGPHPLSLHVASATNSWSGALASFPLFHLGGMQIHPALKMRADKLRADMTSTELDQLYLTLIKKAETRLSDTLSGIRAYQHHPYRRDVSKAPLYHRIGTTEIRDYGTQCSQDAPIVLAVPSLINPAYILDLRQDHSFIRYLSEQNIHPYLLDWTSPDTETLEFDIEDYITKHLIPMIREIHKRHNKKIHLIGYCMGGNLSVAAAQIMQSENIIESLTLIATPWDFHAQQPVHLPALTQHFIAMNSVDEKIKAVPMNIMQLFFFSLDPTLSDKKFRNFKQLNPESLKAKNFVAIEDWANDGAPLSPKVTNDCLINWYHKNQPQNLSWKIADQIINPARLTISGHIITPMSDRIVPPASAHALQKSLPHFNHTIASGGHVTMIAGEKAKTILWHKIALNLK